MLPKPCRRQRGIVDRRGRLLFEIPLALLLAGVYLVLRAQVGDGGLAIVHDHEVLVHVDHMSGELSASDRPGSHTFVPWLESVVKLDRRTLRYVMGTGDLDGVDRCAPALVVRGRDGANYAFGRVEIQAALDPARADVALVDHGGDPEELLAWVDAYARGKLRDAFGVFTPREIVLPDNKQKATEAAYRSLTAALARHGIQVLELSVSKPQFAPKYQETIDRRKVAEQDVERLKREQIELQATAQDRAQSVTAIEERKEALLVLELKEAMRQAERADKEMRAIALRDAEDSEGAALLKRDEDLARAKVIESRHHADAEAFRARLAAIESQGELAVRAALVERLGTITFDIVPYEAPKPSTDVHAKQAAQGTWHD